MIAGTHDGIGYPDSVFRTWAPPQGGILLSSPTPAEPVSLTIDDMPVHFYGMSWNPGASKPPFDEFNSNGAPGFHIAMLHGSLDAAANWELSSRDVPLKLASLQQTGMDYVALGHYHSVKIHPGRPTVAYCGNTEGKRFGEEGPRQFLHVVLEDGVDPIVTPVVCGERVMRDINVDLHNLSLESEHALVAHLKTLADKKDIVRFTLVGDPGIKLDIERLAAELASAFYHLEIRDKSSFLSDSSVLAARDEVSVRGQFVRRMLTLIEASTDDEEKLGLDAALREGFRAFGGEA